MRREEEWPLSQPYLVSRVFGERVKREYQRLSVKPLHVYRATAFSAI